MRNPHRVYETNFHNFARNAGRSTFIHDFTKFVEDALVNPRGDQNPRKAVGMAPEPYRHDSEVIANTQALKKYALGMIEPQIDKWEWLYETLDERDSRDLLISVVAYRAIGWNYVKLPLDNPEFARAVEELENLASDLDA